jgi:hypothetical protein
MRDDATANSPARVAERLRRRAIAEQVGREIEERFPGGITRENAAEVLAWQRARLDELEAEK